MLPHFCFCALCAFQLEFSYHFPSVCRLHLAASGQGKKTIEARNFNLNWYCFSWLPFSLPPSLTFKPRPSCCYSCFCLRNKVNGKCPNTQKHKKRVGTRKPEGSFAGRAITMYHKTITSISIYLCGTKPRAQHPRRNFLFPAQAKVFRPALIMLTQAKLIKTGPD